MIEIKTQQTEQTQPTTYQHNHPECVNCGITQDVKIFSTVGAVSDIIVENELDLHDFWQVVSILSTYYTNWFNILDIDPEDEDEVVGIALPSVKYGDGCC